MSLPFGWTIVRTAQVLLILLSAVAYAIQAREAAVLLFLVAIYLLAHQMANRVLLRYPPPPPTAPGIRFNRPSGIDTAGVIGGLLLGTLLGIIFFLWTAEGSATISTAFSRLGLVTAVLGALLGLRLIRWLVGSRPHWFVLLLVLIGLALGLTQLDIINSGDSNTAVAVISAVLWALALAWVGSWLGERFIDTTNNAIGLVPVIRNSPRWYTIAGALLGAVLGVTLNYVTAEIQAGLKSILRPDVILFAIFFGWIGILIVKWLLRLSFDLVRAIIGFTLAGAVVGIIVLAYTPGFVFTTIRDLLLAGSVLGATAGLMLMVAWRTRTTS